MFRVRRWLPRGITHERPGAVSLVTWRLAPRQPALTPGERDLLCSVLRRWDGQRCRLYAFVVMDDHVHVLVSPLGVPLRRLVHSWKSATSHELQRLHRRAGGVWQADSLEREVRTGEELRHAAEHIVGNPWKRWPFIKGYPWVWEADPLPPTSWPR